MKRRQARRILGLDRRAEGDHVELAHERLRAHIEGRDPAAVDAARTRELEALDAARDALLAASSPARRVAWAIFGVGIALALLLGLSTFFGGGGFGTAAGSGGAAADGVGPMARLQAASDIDGAWLQIVDPHSGEHYFDGPADAQVHELAPGAVRVRVGHDDCGVVWEEELELRAGALHELHPAPCTGTGWLIVESEQASDRLAIDGEPVGPTGRSARPLPAGEHDLRVERPGHEAWVGKVVVEPARTLALWAAPHAAAAPPPTATPKRSAPAAPVRDDPEDGRRFSSWHGRAREWLLSLYDRDRSDALDTEAEVRAVPCRSWEGLAQSYARQGLALPMTRLYGFDGDGFVDGALGVSPRVRDVAYARMRECGLP